MKATNPILLVLDLDGTIVPQNAVRHLNDITNTAEKNNKTFEKFMKGEITKEEYINHLKIYYKNSPNPLTKKDVEKIMKKFSVYEGFSKFIQKMKSLYGNNIIFAIVSSSVKERVEAVAKTYDIKEFYYSTLSYDSSNKLIGFEKFLFPEDKEKYLLELIKKYSPSLIIVIGDSEWDKPMMKHAHITISIDNHDLEAHHTIYHYDELTNILIKEIEKRIKIHK
ncbi:MAG: HAD-IB family phosphatase [Candidatus Nanohaloarchaeota archaeon]|nr:HAD-IB family phosphatase [Candidatus Nanohaloarchaeota archaeon]